MFVEHKEVGEVAEAPAKTMKLSEAIRIGASMTPQCFRTMHNNGATCALGAAVWAVGWRPGGRERDAIAKEYGWDRVPLLDSIMLKNDALLWTREQIADWLEGQGY